MTTYPLIFRDGVSNPGSYSRALNARGVLHADVSFVTCIDKIAKPRELLTEEDILLKYTRTRFALRNDVARKRDMRYDEMTSAHQQVTHRFASQPFDEIGTAGRLSASLADRE